MKKSILTLAIAIASVVGLNSNAFAAKNSREAIVLTDITRINNIEVHGNVDVYLSDGTADQVKVYNDYYTESALVQNKNGVLTISSYKAEKLVVWITVTNLHSLAAYDNAQVKSFGKLSVLDLNVNLYNDASARLNLDAYAVNVKLNDHAKADLEGTVTEADLSYDYRSYLNTTNLDSYHMVKKAISSYPTSNKNLMVEL